MYKHGDRLYAASYYIEQYNILFIKDKNQTIIITFYYLQNYSENNRLHKFNAHTIV
jgi:hypothetical protein